MKGTTLWRPHGHRCSGTCCEGSPWTHSTPARGPPVSAPKQQGYFWPSSFLQAPGDWVTPDAFLSPCRGQGNALQRGAGIWKWLWFGLRFFGDSYPSAAATGISTDPKTRMLPARRKGSGTSSAPTKSGWKINATETRPRHTEQECVWHHVRHQPPWQSRPTSKRQQQHR